MRLGQKTPVGEGFADMIFTTGNHYPKQGTLEHKEKTCDPSGSEKTKTSLTRVDKQ